MIEKLCFVGAGSMAESIIAGILHNQYLTENQITVTNKNKQERLKELDTLYQVQTTTDKKIALQGADVVILAVKPFDLDEALEQVNNHIQPEQMLITVVAGVSTDAVQNRLTQNNPIVRAMPNTSASIGFSVSAITAGKSAGEEDVALAESLFQTIGTTAVVEEADMHTVTAISGSGPAYFYYLVEAMEKAATEAGLDQGLANDLITQTVIGAGEMLKHSGNTAHDLRQNITSPGGTTQAALEALQKNDFQKIAMEAVERAANKSKELGKE